MLKKAGIVVMAAAAGTLSMSSLAFAGNADVQSSSNDDGGSHSSHHHGGWGDDDGGSRGGSCDKIAASGGHNLVDASNLASNLDVSHLNILASDDSADLGGGCHGDKAAVSGGHNLVDASNILSNADLHHVNVLATDSSLSGS